MGIFIVVFVLLISQNRRLGNNERDTKETAKWPKIILSIRKKLDDDALFLIRLRSLEVLCGNRRIQGSELKTSLYDEICVSR